ncbi:MAG: hypothetical protein IJ217_00855 [Clostridia bacterium]|nr:hypothetical protein [Clostridia bacterium]
MEEEIAIQEIDIGSVIIDTINNLCQSLFSSINKDIFPLLDKVVFIKKDIATSHLERILGTDPKTGLLVLANALLAAFVIYYSVRLFMSSYSGEGVESPHKFFLRLFLVAIFMNFSLTICTYIIGATSDITTFICSLGKNIFGKGVEVSFSSLMDTFAFQAGDKVNVFSLNGILSGMLSISSFTLIVSFALRYIVIKVLILLSPFAILCLINQPTTGLFKSWFKCFLSLLLLQIFISLVLLLSYAIIKETNVSPFRELLLVGTIMALLKSNEYVRELMGGLNITSNFSTGMAGLKSMFTR